MAQSRSPRLISLDVFRGLTIFGMIVVNTPGNHTAYALFDHADWNGCTLADLVFPFFLFIVGVAVALAKPDLPKAAKRAAIIFGLGLLLNAIPNWHPETFRWLGVLQRIALCYLGAAWVAGFETAALEGGISAALLLLYWYVVQLRPFTPDGSLEGVIDRAVLGTAHTYRHLPYDPEGLLSTIPAFAQTLLGVAVGRKLLSSKPLFALGAGLAAAGWLWSYAFPFNKQLWTSSYVLWTSGLACLLLGALMAAVDERGKKPAWAKPLEALGVNAIAAYVLPILMLKWLVLHKVHGEQLRLVLCARLFEGWLPSQAASLTFAFAYAALWTVVFYDLRRRGAAIKI